MLYCISQILIEHLKGVKGVFAPYLFYFEEVGSGEVGKVLDKKRRGSHIVVFKKSRKIAENHKIFDIGKNN